MKRLRGYIPTMVILATMVFGATSANAGIITGGRTSEDSTTASASCDEKTTTDILSELVSFVKTGIITGGRLGIITGGRVESSCSTERTGIITGG